MKALLLKEYYNFLTVSKTMVIAIVFMGIIFGLSFDVSIFTIMACTTISTLTLTLIYIDESSHWNDVQRTFPVSLWQITLSKYIAAFVLLCAALICVFVWFVVLSLINGYFPWDVLGISAGIGALFALFFTNILIPITHKYGAEKARVMTIGVALFPVAIAFILKPSFGGLTISPWMLALISIGFVLILEIASIFISKKILEGKENA